MPTSGSATGGNDVFNGKARVFWWLAAQEYLNGAHGQSLIRWAATVNWAPGDGCHWIRSGSVNGNGTIQWSVGDNTHPFVGGHSHSGDWPPVDASSGGGFATGTYVLDHDASGAAQVQVSYTYTASSGGSTAITSVDSLPAIPQTPANPSAATATRVSDTQQSVAWTNNSTGTAPYAGIKVYRTTDGGGYALIATLGVVTSYSDTTTSANHKYTYGINAVGANGVEVGTAATPAVWTTPGAPSTLVAAKIAGGNIRLTWANNVNYSEYQTDIYESQNGGAYVYLNSVATGITTWDHVAPNPAVTHRYKVLANKTSSSLFSAFSNESATIVLLSTANPPTGLAPSGVTRDATEAIVFTWVHNPADGTPQSKYQLQYKIGAGSFVTVGPTTSGVSSYSMPASTVTNGQTITWHVATAGENATLSAYSADSIFTTQNRPTSTISAPGSSYTNSQLNANWTYFQTQGSVQASWHAYLYKKGALGDYSDATLLEEAVGSGTTSSYAFTSTLLDGQVYAVRVYVTSATGLASIDSGTQRKEFTVTYLPPADATVAAVYDPNYGRMVVTITGSSAIPNVQGLVLDGTGDWGSTVDAAALDLTGDFEIAADIKPADWTPAGGTGLAEKWLTASNLSYAFVLLTDGKIRMRITTSGVIGTLVEATSSVAVASTLGITDGTRFSVRARRVGTTLTFYTSPDTNLSTATWTQLGSTQTLTGTIFSGTSPLTIGSNGAGAAFLGTIYSVLVKNAAGTTVAYPIYATQAPGTTSFSDGFSNTWTLVGDANIATSIFGTVAISTVDLQRKINSGEWVTWVTGIVLLGGTPTANVTDTAPTIKGDNHYRAVIRSATPSSKLSPEINVTTAEPLWGFLTTGPGFAQLVRMRARLSNQASVGRNKSTYHFAGRGKPVELSGEETNLALAALATLFPPSMGGMSSEPEELEALALTTGPVLWRDYTGRRIFASLSGVVINYETQANKYPAAFNLNQVDYDENVG